MCYPFIECASSLFGPVLFFYKCAKTIPGAYFYNIFECLVLAVVHNSSFKYQKGILNIS